jgi:hypothetical protein
MKNKEKALLDNKILMAATYVDPRYRILLTKE